MPGTARFARTPRDFNGDLGFVFVLAHRSRERASERLLGWTIGGGGKEHEQELPSVRVSDKKPRTYHGETEQLAGGDSLPAEHA